MLLRGCSLKGLGKRAYLCTLQREAFPLVPLLSQDTLFFEFRWGYFVWLHRNNNYGPSSL